MSAPHIFYVKDELSYIFLNFLIIGLCNSLFNITLLLIAPLLVLSTSVDGWFHVNINQKLHLKFIFYSFFDPKLKSRVSCPFPDCWLHIGFSPTFLIFFFFFFFLPKMHFNNFILSFQFYFINFLFSLKNKSSMILIILNLNCGRRCYNQRNLSIFWPSTFTKKKFMCIPTV